MSTLKIFNEDNDQPLEVVSDFDTIATKLHSIDVRFGRWQANQVLSDDMSDEQILETYRDSIDQLKQEYNFKSQDVVALTPEHPDKAVFRNKFLDEHTHNDFEVRFFVDGKGLFYIHKDKKVYGIMCEKGDLISVPANTTHWFDMGENPHFKCIRLFTTPEGWVAQFTGNDIAKQFPTFDDF